MKKITLTVAVMVLMMSAIACRPTNRHVVIAEGSEQWSLKIEYFGRAIFNRDTTEIAAISKNGLVKYKKNGRTLVAENGRKGAIVYRIDGGQSKTELNTGEKDFVARVVKEMARKGYNNDGKWSGN